MTQTIELLNGFGQVWLGWAISGLMGAFLVAVVVSLAWPALRKRASASLGCWLFFFVILKPFVPLEISLPETIVSSLPSRSVLWQGPETLILPEHRAAEPVLVTGMEEKPVLPISVEPIGRVSRRPVEPIFPATAIRASTWLAMAWCLTVMVLLARFIWNEIRFRQMISGSGELDLPVRPLALAMGIRRPVSVRESDLIAIPAVSGLFRPVILMPKRFLETLAPEEIRWILLHELAHIKRFDLPMALLLRLAGIVLFFNPSIWYAAMRIGTLREYACDDLASAALEGENAQKIGGAALLRVVEHARSVRAPLGEALGAFDFKTSLKNRLGRLLDTRRTIRTRLGLGSLSVLLLVAAIVLPNLSAQPSEPEKEAATPRPAAGTVSPDKNEPVTTSPENAVKVPGIPPEITVSIVDENHKPLKDVLLKAQLVRDKKEFRSDEHGKIVIDTKPYQQKETGWFIFEAYASGRVTTYSRWLRQKKDPTTIPPEFTLRLDPGVTLGGTVVDEKGNPVTGAKVVPSYDHRVIRSANMYAETQRPRSLWEGVLTDSQGRWRVEGYSKTAGQVLVNVTHDDYLPQVEDNVTGAYLMSDLLAGKAKTVLKSGFRVFGTVRNEKGDSIPGAVITFNRPGYGNEPSARRTTGPDGRFEIKSWYKRSTDYTVIHRDRAPVFGKFGFNAREYARKNEAKLDFTLKKGKSIRMKIVDPDGNPIRRYWVCFHSDQPELHDTIPHGPDADGIWEWKNAPDAELSFDVDEMKGFDRIYAVKMKPREEPYVVTARGTTVVTGKVIDSETKKPIGKFNLIKGMIRLKPSPDYGNEFWMREGGLEISDGFYSLRFESSPEPEGGTVRYNALRIEAVGYEPFQSAAIDLNGRSQTMDVALKPSKSKPVRAVLLLPDGRPAVDAEVGLGGISTIAVRTWNDRIAGNTGNAVVKTDEQGRFEFPTPGVPYVILAAHPDGFAFARQGEVETGTVRMIPWARIEGTAYENGKPASGAKIWGSFDMPDELVRRFPRALRYEARIEASANAEGRFVLERVAPGLKGFMGFQNASAHVRTTTESGKTIVIRVDKEMPPERK